MKETRNFFLVAYNVTHTAWRVKAVLLGMQLAFTKFCCCLFYQWQISIQEFKIHRENGISCRKKKKS
jgi:hypothetical protein